MSDIVNSPTHYTRLEPQPIEVVEAWHLGFNLGNALKYLARAGFKDGADDTLDLAKAVFYIQREITNRKKAKAP